MGSSGDASGESVAVAGPTPGWRTIAWTVGPGLIVMLADTDAGNVVTAAQAGAEWGYRLLPLVFALVPMLYLVQELTVRLGIFTGRGHGELIREQFGLGWAMLSTLGLAAATVGSLVTEFSAVAGIGELYGVPRSLSLGAAVVGLLLVVGTGSYRRVERVAMGVGLFELAFFIVAWRAHPDMAAMAREVLQPPVHSREFAYLAAAMIGATFNPWMVFYQQSAIADKKLGPKDYPIARWDTAAGAVVTQFLTAAVLVAVAASFGARGARATLTSVGEISQAFTPVLGDSVGRLVFSVGVLGAAMIAAIVSSLALAWGIGEVAGYRRSLEYEPMEARGFYAVYAGCVVGAALLVGAVGNLVWLNVAAQVLNAFLMPLVIGLLIALAARVLPEPWRLRGGRLWLVVAISAFVSALGIAAGVWGMG